jgi:hypothetical protein
VGVSRPGSIGSMFRRGNMDTLPGDAGAPDLPDREQDAE